MRKNGKRVNGRRGVQLTLPPLDEQQHQRVARLPVEPASPVEAEPVVKKPRRKIDLPSSDDPVSVVLRRPLGRAQHVSDDSLEKRDAPSPHGDRWLVAPVGSTRGVIVRAHTAFDANERSGLRMAFSAVVVLPYGPQSGRLIREVHLASPRLRSARRA